MRQRPLIGISGCSEILDDEPAQMVKACYVDAVSEHAEAISLIIPALGKPEDAVELVPALDGILLTGASSNINPGLYRGEQSSHAPTDHPRDITTLTLIKAAKHFGVPVFGIGRGFQEINVALGGTLADERDLPNITQLHHGSDDADLAGMFGHCHEVDLSPAGLFARIMDKTSLEVNSLHYQRIEKLGDGLRVEASAQDGVVEAIASREADPQFFAVQWHPEWHPEETPHHLSFWRFIGERAVRYKQQPGIPQLG